MICVFLPETERTRYISSAPAEPAVHDDMVIVHDMVHRLELASSEI